MCYTIQDRQDATSWDFAMRVYFDMDGTIADLYGVDGWLDSLRGEDTRPYDIAAPMGDIERLAAICAAHGATVGVISWLAKGASPDYDRRVRQAKRRWIARNFPWAEDIHVVRYGTPKQSVIRGDGAILVDDELPNCDRWSNPAKNRHAIRARNIEQMERELDSLLAIC